MTFSDDANVPLERRFFSSCHSIGCFQSNCAAGNCAIGNRAALSGRSTAHLMRMISDRSHDDTTASLMRLSGYAAETNRAGAFCVSNLGIVKSLDWVKEAEFAANQCPGLIQKSVRRFDFRAAQTFRCEADVIR